MFIIILYHVIIFHYYIFCISCGVHSLCSFVHCYVHLCSLTFSSLCCDSFINCNYTYIYIYIYICVLHETRGAPDYKRRLRLQDTHEMNSLIQTRTQTWNAWDDKPNSDKNTDMAHTKRSTRIQEKRETRRHARDDKPNSEKNTDLEHIAIWSTFYTREGWD